MLFKKVIVVSVFLFCIFLTYLLLFLNNTDTTINVSSKAKYINTLFFPQGWAFFTVNPREEEMAVYKITKDGGKSLLVENSFSPKYLWGINRVNTARLIQFMIIYSKNGLDKKFASFEDDYFDKKNVNKIIVDKCCPLIEDGYYQVVKREITPWSYWRIGSISCYKCQKLDLYISSNK